MARRGYRTTTIDFYEGKKGKKGKKGRTGKPIKLYSGANVANALTYLRETLDMWGWSRVLNLGEALYEHGKKEGAREAFEALDAGMSVVKKMIRHRKPGRPRKPK